MTGFPSILPNGRVWAGRVRVKVVSISLSARPVNRIMGATCPVCTGCEERSI